MIIIYDKLEIFMGPFCKIKFNILDKKKIEIWIILLFTHEEGQARSEMEEQMPALPADLEDSHRATRLRVSTDTFITITYKLIHSFSLHMNSHTYSHYIEIHTIIFITQKFTQLFSLHTKSHIYFHFSETHIIIFIIYKLTNLFSLNIHSHTFFITHELTHKITHLSWLHIKFTLIFISQKLTIIFIIYKLTHLFSFNIHSHAFFITQKLPRLFTHELTHINIHT